MRKCRNKREPDRYGHCQGCDFKQRQHTSGAQPTTAVDGQHILFPCLMQCHVQAILDFPLSQGQGGEQKTSPQHHPRRMQLRSKHLTFLRVANADFILFIFGSHSSAKIKSPGPGFICLPGQYRHSLCERPRPRLSAMSGLKHAGDESVEDVFLQNHLGPSIAEHAKDCRSLLREYIKKPGIVPDPTILDDQAARFSLWASNMAVFGEPNISLDYRLRFSPAAAGIVHQLLDVIRDTLLSREFPTLCYLQMTRVPCPRLSHKSHR